MRIRPIQWYVAFMVVFATGMALAMDWDVLLAVPTFHLLWGLALLGALGLLSEATAFSHRIAKEAGNSSLVFLPLIVAVILFGPAAGVLFIGLTAAVAEVVIRRKELLRCLFNTAQYVLATAVAGNVFLWLGGRPLVFDMLAAEASFLVTDQLLPILAFGVVLFFLNHVFVGVALAFAHGQGLFHTLSRTFGRSGLSLVHDLLVLPLAILIAWLYFELQWIGLITSLVPLTLVRYAYLSMHQLEIANRDLLKALVKAIEIRDPYTSGHSLRVQRFAQSIAQGAGLGERRLRDVGAAALLHDVGKIELVYEEVIKKPGQLSNEEMELIQSHVTRGVEILTSLSSVNPRIINGVRSHHERFDGAGYPDGLSGHDIPIEGRIIAICDAVDAMLSDRPYRKALPVEVVIEELRKFSGSQFDPDLVKVVETHDLVRKHRDIMALERSLGSLDVLEDDVTELLLSGQAL